ncbi:unnamed protein product [Prorocentrum cordatum]|uniref:Calmodulin n=1 Tax=Prorocentrum cordatum TaxID=2364126 RepID=A0ABN9QRM8_9DINO|nr:unnamed protein product [Polarella glacialis]
MDVDGNGCATVAEIRLLFAQMEASLRGKGEEDPAPDLEVFQGTLFDSYGVDLEEYDVSVQHDVDGDVKMLHDGLGLPAVPVFPLLEDESAVSAAFADIGTQTESDGDDTGILEGSDLQDTVSDLGGAVSEIMELKATAWGWKHAFDKLAAWHGINEMEAPGVSKQFQASVEDMLGAQSDTDSDGNGEKYNDGDDRRFFREKKEVSKQVQTWVEDVLGIFSKGDSDGTDGADIGAEFEASKQVHASAEDMLGPQSDMDSDDSAAKGSDGDVIATEFEVSEQAQTSVEDLLGPDNKNDSDGMGEQSSDRVGQGSECLFFSILEAVRAAATMRFGENWRQVVLVHQAGTLRFGPRGELLGEESGGAPPEA